MILAYHRVNPWYRDDALTVSPENFDRQLAYLVKKRFRIVSLSEYLTIPQSAIRNPQSRMAVISFDDGYADNLLYAWPVLKKYGVKPVIFLTVNYIGTEKVFPRYKDAEKDRLLRWKEVQTLAREGVEFGSHTLTHPRLTGLDRKDAWDEIFQSRKRLEENLGRGISYFCYPYGDWNRTIAEAVKNAGYKGAVLTGRSNPTGSPYTLPRAGIYGHNSFLVYRIKIWRAGR